LPPVGATGPLVSPEAPARQLNWTIEASAGTPVGTGRCTGAIELICPRRKEVAPMPGFSAFDQWGLQFVYQHHTKDGSEISLFGRTEHRR
jgi:hypothetical protein